MIKIEFRPDVLRQLNWANALAIILFASLSYQFPILAIGLIPVIVFLIVCRSSQNTSYWLIENNRIVHGLQAWPGSQSSNLSWELPINQDITLKQWPFGIVRFGYISGSKDHFWLFIFAGYTDEYNFFKEIVVNSHSKHISKAIQRKYS